MPGRRKCEPDCKCGKHFRSAEHNRRIGEANAYAHRQKVEAQKERDRLARKQRLMNHGV